ncbi:hypothetical protein [Ensifer adhaerens]|uniref:hypothetical protein n=1 Tax=Ensifer adhaerens TaxID=106592 RepID=UPI001568324B|nr:hypothetical protein [Ensifer adhaerens]
MTVTIEVKSGHRRILEYLFSPLAAVAPGATKEDDGYCRRSGEKGWKPRNSPSRAAVAATVGGQGVRVWNSAMRASPNGNNNVLASASRWIIRGMS